MYPTNVSIASQTSQAECANQSPTPTPYFPVASIHVHLEPRLQGKNYLPSFICSHVVLFVFSWSALPTSDPTYSARNTVFFRTVELAYNQGNDS